MNDFIERMKDPSSLNIAELLEALDIISRQLGGDLTEDEHNYWIEKGRVILQEYEERKAS